MIYLNQEVFQIINDTQGKILINERNFLNIQACFSEFVGLSNDSRNLH